jgi:hypothetical protein
MSSFQRDPIYPCEPALLKEFKDLLELVESQEQTDQAITQMEGEIVSYGRLIAPLIFARLYRTIDHDLLFTSETDLVMPDIKKISAKVLNEAGPEMGRSRLSPWMVDVISREVREYISQRGPGKLGSN